MCSVYLNMDTVSDKTHIQTIFNFSPGVGVHFIGNALCSSDVSVEQLIHILHFFSINSVLFKPPEKKNPDESNLEDYPGSGSTSSYPTIKILLVQKGTNTTEDVG